ncbi:hypothetical protein [Bradyrhizobium sp. AZCC 1678]
MKLAGATAGVVGTAWAATPAAAPDERAVQVYQGVGI